MNTRRSFVFVPAAAACAVLLSGCAMLSRDHAGSSVSAHNDCTVAFQRIDSRSADVRLTQCGPSSGSAPVRAASLSFLPAFGMPALPDAAADDTPICKRTSPTTGTRLGVRVICMTENEWAASLQDDREKISDEEHRTLVDPMYGGDN